MTFLVLRQTHKLNFLIHSIISAKGLIFPRFSDLSNWVLTSFQDCEFPLTKQFMSIILVLPFCTADCERAFSSMNLIKSKLRNRMKEILNSLMIIFNRDKTKPVRITKLSKKIARSVWKYNKEKPWSSDYDRSSV